MSENELLPCPLCKKEARRENTIIEAVVRCLGCGLMLRKDHKQESDEVALREVTKAWNTRPSPAVSATVAEGLVEKYIMAVDGYVHAAPTRKKQMHESMDAAKRNLIAALSPPTAKEDER